MASEWDEFLDNRTANEPAPQPRANGNVISITDTNRERRYAETALKKESELVAFAAEGTRNDSLNRAAFAVARFIDNGLLSIDEVEFELITAARANGLRDAEIRATLNSALRGRTAKPHKGPIVPESSFDSTTIEVDAETLQPTGENEAEARDLHNVKVLARAYEFRINDEARQLWAAEQAKQLSKQASPPVGLDEFLAVPDDEAQYRIADLLPVGGRALLAAQYKAGKTSLIDNLLKAFADGRTFLGEYPVSPVTVGLVDTELDARQLRRWLRSHSVTNTAAVRIKPLRGEVSTFNILDKHIRTQWAQWFRGANVLILDCLRPCLDALGLSEDKDAGKFLVAFDELLKEAEISEAVLVHHMGHSGERSRGDSRLLDWPDVTWRIIKDKDGDDPDDPNVARYFSAYGRDVDVPEGLLEYNHDTRELTYRAGSRSSQKAQDALPQILHLVRNSADGLSANDIEARLKGSHPRKVIREAVQKAIKDGAIYVETEGKSHVRRHFISPAWRA